MAGNRDYDLWMHDGIINYQTQRNKFLLASRLENVSSGLQVHSPDTDHHTG